MCDAGDSLVSSDRCLLWQTVPQLAVLGICDMLICHGGINSVNEAILAAVPMVCLPSFVDQFQIANQVLIKTVN